MANNRTESQLKEYRAEQAQKNGYIGAGGKPAVIAQILGEEIYNQNSSDHYQVNPLPDFYDIVDENEIPVMDMDEVSSFVGYAFDAYSDGRHFEITFMENTEDIKVSYQGQIVYQENSGDLEVYVPGAWEDLILIYHQKCREKVKSQQKETPVERLEELTDEAMEKITRKWGTFED